jgi:hypothetical protein
MSQKNQNTFDNKRITRILWRQASSSWGCGGLGQCTVPCHGKGLMGPLSSHAEIAEMVKVFPNGKFRVGPVYPRVKYLFLVSNDSNSASCEGRCTFFCPRFSFCSL